MEWNNFKLISRRHYFCMAIIMVDWWIDRLIHGDRQSELIDWIDHRLTDWSKVMTSSSSSCDFRYLANGLTFCGNANLLSGTTDGIDYQSCPDWSEDCDYSSAFWSLASTTVSLQYSRSIGWKYYVIITNSYTTSLELIPGRDCVPTKNSGVLMAELNAWTKGRILAS